MTRLLLSPRLTLAVAAIAAFILGTAYIIAPGPALAPYGLTQPDEIWIRVVGVLAIAIGILHTGGALADADWYYSTSVIERTVAGLLQIALALTIAPWQLALFGTLDLISAGWTVVALISQRRQPPDKAQ